MIAENLLLRVSTATGVGTPVLRAVWLREASSDAEGELTERCQRRLTEFATRGKQSQDGDLWPTSLTPITAASTLLLWDDAPVDSQGASLMELGGRVTFSVEDMSVIGTVVRSASNEVTVLASDGLHLLSPSEVTCI